MFFSCFIPVLFTGVTRERHTRWQHLATLFYSLRGLGRKVKCTLNSLLDVFTEVNFFIFVTSRWNEWVSPARMKNINENETATMEEKHIQNEYVNSNNKRKQQGLFPIIFSVMFFVSYFESCRFILISLFLFWVFQIMRCQMVNKNV